MDPSEENIRLHLVTPNYGNESQTPTQIMEADNDTEEEIQEAENKYIIPDLQGDGLDADTEPLDPNDQSMMGVDDPEDEASEMDGENAEEEVSDAEDLEGKSAPLSENEEEVSDGEVKSPLLGPMGTDDRVSVLETEFKRSKNRLDGFSQELKILLVEVNIVCDWITENFGVELIDKASQLFKHIHDFEEIEELSQSLSLLKKGNGTRRSNRRKLSVPKKKASPPPPNKKKRGRGRPRKSEKLKKKKDDSESEDEDDFEGEPVTDEVDAFFDPPECVLNTDVEEDFFKTDAKPKRKRVRKRTPKKLVKEGDGVDEGVEVKEEDKDAQPEEETGPKKRKKWKAPQRSLQCEECGKILKADSSLRWHMLMHADLRPVECTEPGCGKSFRDKSKLAQHMKIHNGEKSEKCRYCDRGFLRKKDLIVHERTHTGEKPFACPSCPKTFNIKDHLTIHLRVHTGERPYKCLICEKAFSQANSLRIHKKIHLKQAGELVPPPRKPRGPRKAKHVVTIHEQDPSPSSLSHAVILERVDLDDTKAMNLHEDGTGQGMDTPSPSDASEPHSLVQNLFQVQSLNLVDPVQQAWNIVTADQLHQHQQQQIQHHATQQQQQQLRTFVNPSLAAFGQHLGAGIGLPSHGPGFKIQHYNPHSQQQQQQQQHVQSLNVIRNPNPLAGQGGPFVPTQFHDPNFRTFPN